MNNPSIFESKSSPNEKISQDFEPKTDEKPWERQRNEPARWYMRFQRYRDMGSKRSLRAVVAGEPQDAKATKGDKEQEKSEGVALSDLSVPGAWSRAAKTWLWLERAKAYDLHKQEAKATEMREMAAIGSFYASKTMRIIELSNLAEMLKRNIKGDMGYKDFLALIGRIQSIFHDIDALAASMGESFEGMADTAAHKKYTDYIAAQAARSVSDTKKYLTDLKDKLKG